MLKAKMKQFLALVIAGTMLCSYLPVSASSTSDISTYAEETTEFTVSFENAYAKVGVPLTATATGAAEVTYQWYVGEKLISENTSASYTPTEDDLEKWIEVRVNNGTETVSSKMYCSNLPVVYIDTENGQSITSKTEYIDATIKIQGNDEYSDSGILYEGATEIRGRGNTTWGQPKKPYKLKLDKKANVFGMGKSKHWVLLANYLDESLMRNTLAYRLAGDMQMDEMSTVWVDVIMNGKYVGNYQFCENVRVDDTRVDIFDWEGFAEDSADTIAETEGFDKTTRKSLESYMSENMGWITSGQVTFQEKTYVIADYPAIKIPDINGGYLLELDAYWDEVSKFKTDSGQPLQFKNPEYVNTNSEMFDYVQNYVQAFEDAVTSSDYMTSYEGEDTHYSDLYDFNALVDYWLVTEIFFNEEMNKKSTYMYKDIDGKMIMGPIWDMDWSSGAGGTAAGSSNQWATNYYNQGAQSSQWYKYLVKDPYFLMKLQERYWEIRNDQVQDMLDNMDVYYDQIKESGKADSILWHGSGVFDKDYQGLKTWLNAHITWMDQQMATEDSFDSAFLNKNNALTLSLTDAEGNTLMEDYAANAPADAFTGKSADLQLHITGNVNGTAEIYINSRLSGTVSLNGQETVYTIEAAALTEEIETKNVIEVKVKNNYGGVSASNYITVRQSTCDHSFAGAWSKNDTQHWKECEHCQLQFGLADHTFEWVIDQEATEGSNGIRHEECTICGYTRAKETYEYVELPADPSDDSKDISTSMMTAISGSEQSGNEDDYILDGNPSTIWHTQHGMIHTLEERWCGVNLSEPVMVSGIRCLPRTDGGNGTVTEYSVQYRTSDNGEWIEAATGTWDYDDLSWKLISFTPVMAKQVRIVGVHTHYNGNTQDKHMSMAEFRLIGGGSGETIKADKTALNEAIKKAKDLKEEDYTAESWKSADLANVIASAEEVAKDENASQEAVDTEAAALKAAVAKLEEKGEEPPVEEKKVVRLSGSDRYATGFAVADELKAVLGVDQFETVIIATGTSSADALSGSYLAAVKQAPILLTNGKAANVEALHAYIEANAEAGATIYVLGGEKAVSAEAAAIEGYDVVRLAGTSRYETNLKILEEAGYEGQEDLLVATGKDFADSLSASAAARPILLVKPGTALTDAQKAVAENFKNIYVIGGIGAVSDAVAEELAAYGTVTRLSGKNRYETSIKVAETFFEEPKTVLLASGKKFPDGLCGGALAATLNAPLVLTKDGAESTAADYVTANGIASGYVLGGEGAVSNDTVVTVFGLDSFSNGSNEIISVADARRNEFYHNITEFETTGTVYYISNSGNDNNDGLSPETAWATLDRAFETYWPLTRDFLKPGDTVLLERGGTWYISSDEIEGLTSDAYNVVDGVTLGAYGEGARPIIRGDIPEANNPAFWEQYYDENGVKIWASVEPLQDSNVIVFNDGESYAEEVMPYWSIALNNYCNAEGEAFDIEAALENDLSFCCMLNLDNAESMDLKNSTAKGTLYLRCDKGNPAEVFEKIAVPQAQTGLVLHTDATLIDLDIRYFTCIAAALSGYDGHSGQQVSNCEVSWCGGLISEYQTFDSEVVGLLSPYCSGGALQVSGSENSVRDCYIHHCGPMTLICSIHVDEPGICKLENMAYTGNLIEYCGSALHIADLSKMDDDNAEGYISNLIFSDNIVMYSGESWIKNHILRISDEHSAFFSAVENAMGASNNDGIYITNNIFYGSCASLLYITDNLWNDTGKVNQSMSFSSNVYAQYKEGILCNFNWERGYRVGCALEEQEFLAFIGDTTGTVVTIQ